MAYVSLITNLESILLISGQHLLDLYLEIYCHMSSGNDAFSRADNKYYYCKFGNFREDFIFAKLRTCEVS